MRIVSVLLFLYDVGKEKERRSGGTYENRIIQTELAVVGIGCRSFMDRNVFCAAAGSYANSCDADANGQSGGGAEYYLAYRPFEQGQ